jgi:putative membrane protein
MMSFETAARERASLPLPRIEPEELPAPRLEPPTLPAIRLPRRQPGSLSLVFGGVAVLALGLAALETGNFIAAEFGRSIALGLLTLAVALGGFGLIGLGCWRELRGLFALGRVDRVRAALAGTDLAAARAAARRWVAGLAEGEAVLPAIAAADTAEAVAALLRAGPAAALRARSEALSRAAAVQIFAATAAVPSPLFDGLLVGWRALRLMRQVAELYGVRPGVLATAGLLRRTILSAASVLTADVAANAALHGLASHPLLRHAAGDLAGATIAARRMTVLARATASACDPVAPEH